MQVKQLLSERYSKVNVVGVDGLPADVCAMLQAFYSRSHRPIMERLSELNIVDEHGNATVSNVEHAKFEKMRDSLNQYYIGYGHDSIADCGSVTFFVEGVSFLVAKAIQDDPLYNGQETSSRYIDFMDRQISDPFEPVVNSQFRNEASTLYRKNIGLMLTMYQNVRNKVSQSLLKDWEAENEGQIIPDQVARGLRAKAFDVARGFLPIGCTTQLSIHVKLRTMRDMLTRLLNHPLAEVRGVAEDMRLVFNDMYPTLLVEKVVYVPNEEQNPSSDIRGFYQIYPGISRDYEPLFLRSGVHSKARPFFAKGFTGFGQEVIVENTIDADFSKAFPYPLPKKFVQASSYHEMQFELDFGSFRDVQRHRASICFMPVVNEALGFHRFYLDSAVIANDKVSDATDFHANFNLWIEEVIANYRKLKALIPLPTTIREGFPAAEAWQQIQAQYALPMGMKTLVYMQQDAAQTSYLFNLRGKPTVHQTLRQVIHTLHEKYEEGLVDLLEDEDLAEDCARAFGLNPINDTQEDANRRGRATITNNGTEIK